MSSAALHVSEAGPQACKARRLLQHSHLSQQLGSDLDATSTPSAQKSIVSFAKSLPRTGPTQVSSAENLMSAAAQQKSFGDASCSVSVLVSTKTAGSMPEAQAQQLLDQARVSPV